jgi:hypothetical protein
MLYIFHQSNLRWGGFYSSFHEPENTIVDFQVVTHFWFMGREQVKKEQRTFHEPLYRAKECRRSDSRWQRHLRSRAASQLAAGV